MSANIYIDSKDTAAFASTQPAWHGLGQIVLGAMTSEECVRYAQLDYTVQKMPIVAKIPSGKFVMDVPIIDNYATVRTDTSDVLGVVGKKYTILQNTDAFKFFDAIVGEGTAMFETAGALGKGERIFITAKLPGILEITPEDVLDQYLFLTNSHDGSGSVTAFFTPVRVVCNNTFNMAMQDHSRKLRLRHTTNIVAALEEAHQFMGIVNQQSQSLLEECQMMTKQFITDEQLRRYVELALKPSLEQITDEEFSARFTNQVDSIVEYALSDETQLMDSTRGTIYGAFNSITGYYNNIKEYETQEDKVKQIIYGNGKVVSNRAYQMGLQSLSSTDFLN